MVDRPGYESRIEFSDVSRTLFDLPRRNRVHRYLWAELERQLFGHEDHRLLGKAVYRMIPQVDRPGRYVDDPSPACLSHPVHEALGGYVGCLRISVKDSVPLGFGQFCIRRHRERSEIVDQYIDGAPKSLNSFPYHLANRLRIVGVAPDRHMLQPGFFAELLDQVIRRVFRLVILDTDCGALSGEGCRYGGAKIPRRGRDKSPAAGQVVIFQFDLNDRDRAVRGLVRHLP